MSDEKILAVLTEIRNWTRAASFGSVSALLEKALPDAKSRAAYQMLDGTVSMEEVRVKCKMSPNGLLELAKRCSSMGLMEIKDDGKRLRVFDLKDFGLIRTKDPSGEKLKQ